MKKLLIAMVLMWAQIAYSGTAYYVRIGGSDGAAGTSWATAWATTAKVQATVVAGDSVYFGRGIWTEVRIVPPAGGSNTNWTVYACSTFKTGTTAAQKLAGKNLTIWTGAKAVTGWADTTIAGTVCSKSTYNPSVFCKTDDGQGTPGQAFAARLNRCDSMLIPLHNSFALSSMGGLNGIGKFYSTGDPGGNMIYMRGYHGPLSATDTAWISCEAPLAFDNNNTNHIRVWGIQIEMGHNGAVVYRASNIDSTFVEHGHVRMGGQSAGNNGSAVYAEGQGQINCSDNHVRSCSLAWGVTTPPSLGPSPTDGLRHGGISTIYSQHHFVFDSCYGYGWAAQGFFFKTSKYDQDPWLGSTVKNCIVDGTRLFGDVGLPGCGILYVYEHGDDSAYGNIVKNCVIGICVNHDGDALHSHTFTCFNNTVYNTTLAAIMLNYTNTWTAAPYTAIKVYYNVAVNSGAWSGGAFSFRNQDNTLLQDTTYIDSNYWWRSGGATTFQCFTGGSGISWTGWTTAGDGNCNNGRAFDVHGLNSNPGLNDPASGDFSRPSASGEMNRSYGGQNWTIWGAVQVAGQNVCPTLIANYPGNGGTITDPTPTLDIDFFDTDGDTLDAVLIFEDGDPTPEDTLADTTLIADDDWLYTTATLTEDHTYYWKVIACDTAGCCDTTAIYHFTFDSEGTPTPNNPRRGILIRPNGPE